MVSKYGINDIVGMRKRHARGTNRFKIIRMDADIRIRREDCQRSIMIPRRTFGEKFKKIIESHDDIQRQGNDQWL